MVWLFKKSFLLDFDQVEHEKAQINLLNQNKMAHALLSGIIDRS